MAVTESRSQLKVIALSVGLTALVFSAAGGILYAASQSRQPKASAAIATRSPSPAVTPSPSVSRAVNPYTLISDFRKLEHIEKAALAAAETAYQASPQTQAELKTDWLAKAQAEEDFIAAVELLVFPINLQADANAYVSADGEFASSMRAYGGCQTVADCQVEKGLAQSATAKVTGAYNVLNGDLLRAIAPSP